MGRLTRLGVALLLLGAAAPAAAREGAPARAHAPLPLEGAACLSPVPGQECTVEDHIPGLCALGSDPHLRPPEPVIVDCRDPSVEWVQEMVGECDMPPKAGEPFVLAPERDGPREPACLEAESCSAPQAPVAAGTTATQVQPVAVAGGITLDPFLAGGRVHCAVLLRHDPGHHPGPFRPPDPAA